MFEAILKFLSETVKLLRDPDQFFVNFQQLVVGYLPEAWRPLASSIIAVSFILVVFPALFSITTIFERKGIGRIQNRYGPNRVGIPFTKIRLAGFGQFLPDGLKMLTKEDIVPRAADKVVHLKMVNATNVAQPLEIELKGMGPGAHTGKMTSLHGATFQATNSITAPDVIKPVEGTVSFTGAVMKHTVPAYSVEVVDVKVQ